MIIGIDFDNTIACYDEVFDSLIAERGIQVKSNQSSKDALKRSCIESEEGEVAWARIQGQAYGPDIAKAKPYPGFQEFLEQIARTNHSVGIISHKSIFPTIGTSHNMRSFASEWIENHLQKTIELLGARWLGIQYSDTLQNKLARIAKMNCHVFVDDLPALLNSPIFPSATIPLLFSPKRKNTESNLDSIASWNSVFEFILNIPKQEPRKNKNLAVKDINTEVLAGSILKEEIQTYEILEGGNNNEVAKVKSAAKEAFIVKRYPTPTASDPRDRLHHEVSFLTLCAESKVPLPIPKLIQFNAKNSIAFIELIEGKLPQISDTNNESLWSACTNFLESLQTLQNTEAAKRLPTAAEGCATLQEHLDETRKRRDIWLERANQGTLEPELEAFITGPLERTFQQLAAQLISSPLFRTTPQQDEFIISPSDFGLHNCLVDSLGNATFIDFEYAGWDDPAKTIADFFCQPRLPAPPSLEADFTQSALKGKTDAALNRIHNRLPLVKACTAFKWLYKILNYHIDSAPPDELVEILFTRLKHISKI